MARNIRQQALQKIAALSAANSTTSFDRSDLDRLCKATTPAHGKGKEPANGSARGHHPSLARVPMTIREFEVLLALCKAAPVVESSQSAQKLVHQLVPYMLEAHSQTFQLSPFFRKIEPSPIEALTTNLTAALLALGDKYESLYETVSDNVWTFLASIRTAVEGIGRPSSTEDVGQHLDDAMRTATIAIALLGFLNAACAQADFWRIGGRLALVHRVRNLLSDSFLTAVDGAFSTIRNAHTSDKHAKEWKRYLKHYDHQGRPLGPFLLQQSFMWLLVSATSLLVVDGQTLRGSHILDRHMADERLSQPGYQISPDADVRSLELYSSIAQEEMERLEASADFLQMGSASQQRLAYAVKSGAIISFLNCSVLNEDAADPDVLSEWLQECVDDSMQMLDETLASTVLRSMAVLSKISPNSTPTIVRLLPRFIVQSSPSRSTIAMASRCLASVLRGLSHDAIISTLYTLGNVLSPSPEHGIANGSNGDLGPDGSGISNIYQGRPSTGSDISLELRDDEDTSAVYANIIQAICSIASICNDEKITALAQAMLLQKLGKVNHAVDAQIIPSAGSLALEGGQLEFRSLLRLYSRQCHTALADDRDQASTLNSVREARNYISANIKRNSPLFRIYWEYMLEEMVSKGDVHHSHHMKDSDIEFAAREIAELIQPLAVFMSTHDLASGLPGDDDDSHSLIRDAWFNIVVHGFNPSTDRGKKHINELRIMAIHSPPLVAEQRGEQIESDIELNTVLRRANTSEREAKQKKYLAELIKSKANDIRGLSYRKVIFLQAAYLVESLRADSGDCTKILSYFLEPSMQKEDVNGVMTGIMTVVVDQYLAKTLEGKLATFSAQYAASQLAVILCACCHRIKRVQHAAIECADKFIRDVPSSICHRSSLFALLELLSLMYSSCLEAETDKYGPRSVFSSELGNITLELSDDYIFRRQTLNNLYQKAQFWLPLVLNLAPADVKGLLQTYLSEFDDEGAYGHVSLGRSFAMKIGASIPSTDQRLNSLEPVGQTVIDTASDFVAQYTTRQEYRYGEALPNHGMELAHFMPMDKRGSFMRLAPADRTSAVAALAHVESRVSGKRLTPLNEVREILRRAAALLCRSEKDESAITHYLVSIPFKLFTKESIKLGVSLWLGVMNENPRMEPRLLAEIVQQWEITLQKKLGLFNPSLMHPDPFYLKEEFAPSDNEGLAKRRQIVHDLLAPHTRLIQFFVSHFNATRLGSPDTQRIFLPRELRLRILLFSIRVLRVSSSSIGAMGQWRLKDKILSAGLSWFRYTPKWSFGSNNLQLKTEIRLISDVMQHMNTVSYIGAHAVGVYKPIPQKESLLQILLESEQARLGVWVQPLNEVGPRPDIMTNHGKNALEVTLKPLVRVAWDEHPALAIELVSRFPTPGIHSAIVQGLRYDALGYVERYIVETAQFSQLFAHQIIWNMKANSYKDDDGTIPDGIKPALDKVMDKMIASFTAEDKSFYEREFAFFDEVTSISGKLKPYIPRPKPEKKQKIEEELRKIKVEVGVYLPSNPDGVVIGIDRKSGKPLQSHAKAPFMATFRIKKTQGGVEGTEEVVHQATDAGQPPPENTIETWQSAIFKVGDDCRQDVLALQMISAFRGIFHDVGLDVFVFPYRVTATAPGCGVIDVLPNSISRDMVGREAVNGLYDYFISKYGNEDSLRYQHARSNFAKSMAAYSIISYLLQFKDRHNGNIMIDDAGHLIHIDFGFCFDIAPGGVRFERAPFKLTREMLAVLGGGPDHQAFRWFEELCVKAFLAARPHADKLSQIVLLMMDSGLPCFKPDTIRHFRERFVLERNERDAADYCRELVRKSAGSYSTMVYDQFQLITNGIPY
ncbi:Phosphatidylinositol 4-kinase stt4 [Diatrype stigma]|uniref:1-phosphatidylinositol 4-kinase n=1 Tax=Diatrype stigma TaxID=117547 RepID=A0AAN9UJ28_9PEZI